MYLSATEGPPPFGNNSPLPPSNKPMRPSWQIDLKWAAGLLACFAVVAAGVLFSLTHITQSDTALPLSTALISADIKDRVSDEEYAQVQAEAAANPDAPISLSPTLVVVKGSEIAGLSKDDGARLIGGRLAQVLYEMGDDAATRLIPDRDPNADKAPISFGPAAVLSDEYHSKFSNYLLIALVLSALLLGVVASLGRGFGRLGAPAFVVALGTAPMAIIWTLAGPAIGEGDPDGNPIVLAARSTARSAAADLKSTFIVLLVIAVAVTAVAFFGGIVLTLTQRAREAAEISEPLSKPSVLADKPQSVA